MSVKSMQGTSAHISYLKSNEENRRHKTKCIYFDKGICKCGAFTNYMCKCTSSVLCNYYKVKG
ncbi:hypothetical protein [Clostridium algidicarnis]|uniref:hypothetical protein n=1 Tax=Clostridium algidicarnis TaxID=37659 RepID=UPI001C0E694E|nr:hypothetical protein [Clostridium algidicarnis]MBU3203601.1 hypothetical protein [Clostridium algidicarnis]MBU3211755.1 hypothetical protein [Clostridium algidicarnis]MBU3221738.1 hypothetical protein [Clostridium algidicarnis]